MSEIEIASRLKKIKSGQSFFVKNKQERARVYSLVASLKLLGSPFPEIVITAQPNGQFKVAAI